MRKTLFLLCGVLLALLIAPLATQAQNTPNIQNLQNLKVDELSDDQIKKFIQQAESSGYSQQQLEVLARARGMSEAEISKLRARILKIQGQSGATSSGQTVLRNRTGADINSNQQSDPSTAFDPFGTIFPKDTLVDKDQLEIFGRSFFKNQNLTFEPSVNIPTPANYLLGAGDELIIDVWGASEQTYQLTISPEGNVVIPSLGPIYLNGLTVERAEARLKSRLKDIYSTLGENTFAQLSLGQLRTISVNVVGEVERPGTYQMSSFGTAFNALYLAGGPSETGSLRKIQVFRGGQKVASLDAYEFLVFGKGQSIMLQDQDVILVSPHVNLLTVKGEVKRPAIYEALEGETLERVVEFAGGFTANAYTRSISVQRNLANRKTVQTVMANAFDTLPIKAGDVVEVGKIQNLFENRVRVEGAVNHPGEFELTEGMMLSDLMELIDGFRPDAFMHRAVIIRQQPDLSLANLAFSPERVVAGEEDLALQSEDLIKVQSIFDLQEVFTVSVQGEVLQPGNYPHAEGMTVENLIYLANGFKETAARSFVEVARRVTDDTGNGSISSQIFNFPISQNLGLSEEDSGFELQPFDVVVIRQSPFYEKQKTIEVEGEVQYPGKYVLQSRDERISDVLKRTGGLTNYAYAKGATLIRRTEYFTTGEEEGDVAARIRREELTSLFERDTLLQDGDLDFKTQESIGINLQEILRQPGSKFDLILKEGDVISIPRELQTVRVRGEALYPSTIPYEKNASLKRFVNRAGGYTSDAKASKVYVIYANGSSARTRSFLWFKDYPAVEPGAEIIIPEKPAVRKLSPQEILGLSSSILSMVLIIDRLTN